MTEETPAEEPDEPDEPADDDTEPNESASIQYRGADGEWHELDVEPKQTGDPELDAIWAMSFDELQGILEDESHPLHEKAKQVSREITQPIVDAASEIMRPITQSLVNSLDTSAITKALAPKIDMKGLFPALDTSWFAKLLPDMPKFELSADLTKQFAAPANVAPLSRSTIAIPDQRWIDLDTVEPPDASLTEIQEAAEARAHEMRSRQIELLSEMLAETRASAASGKEALEVSKQALDATKSSKRAGWIAAWAAIGAAVIGIAGIIVTVLLSP